MKKLSIVIPAFNEHRTIEEVVRRVSAAKLPPGWEKEIIVVDDCSTDGTSDVLKRLGASAKVITCAENGGKGAALKEGLTAVTGDYVLIQDADLEYDPADYPALLAPIDAGESKVVFGSRTLGKNKVPLSRIFFYGGLLVTKIFNFLFRSHFSDVATCYKVFPAKYAGDLQTLPSGDFVYDVIELSHYLAKREKIAEVPIRYESRHAGQGKKMSWRHGARCLRRMAALFIAEKARRFSRICRRMYTGASRFIETRPYLSVFLAFSLFFTVFFLMYFGVSTVSSSDDHFFHFRFAQEMLYKGFFHSFQDFKSIYISRMAQGNDYFVYYNFLFFLVIIPFTFITPLFLGIKLYAVFVVAAAFTLLYWCLKKFEVKNPFVWTLVIIAITNVGSIWRFFLSRPYALAPSLLLLLLVFLYRRNWIGAFIVSFAYLYWHSATFFLPICVAIAYFLIEKFYREKGDWKGLAAVAGGTALAVITTYLVSSGFLFFMKDTVFSIYWETIIGKKVSISEGGELYPIDFFDFIQANAVVFAAFVTALSVDIFGYGAFRFGKLSAAEYFAGLPPARRHLHTAVLLLTAGFFLGAVATSARFGDYFTMFAGLYIALSFDYVRRQIAVTGSAAMKRSIAAGLTVVLIYLFASTMIFLQQRLAYGTRPYDFYRTGTWFAEHTKPGDVVFDANWSWFPQLYYWSPKNYYTSGLEPRFMYNYRPDLFWAWTHIAQDAYVCREPTCPDLVAAQSKAFKQAAASEKYAKEQGDLIAKTLSADFHASYIMSYKSYLAFNYVMDHNQHFKREFYDADQGYSIYSIH